MIQKSDVQPPHHPGLGSRLWLPPVAVAAENLGFARKVQQLPPAVRDNGDKARRVAGLFVNSSREADTAQQILESGV